MSSTYHSGIAANAGGTDDGNGRSEIAIPGGEFVIRLNKNSETVV